MKATNKIKHFPNYGLLGSLYGLKENEVVYALRALFTPKGCHLSVLLILILYSFFLTTDTFCC